MKTATVDDKRVAYHDDTEFLVQVGKNKGSYKTVYSFKGDLGKACFHYSSLNVFNGHKKRLLMPSSKKSVIARYISGV